MIFNESTGSSGGVLTVLAPAGVRVNITKDTYLKSKIADTDGIAIFRGLSDGVWSVQLVNGDQSSSVNTIKITTGYSISMGFFSATISVTYPAGSICTCSCGSTTLTAKDTSGKYDFIVPNTGNWTVSVTDGNDVKSETVNITSDGQTKSVELSYALYLFKAGDLCENVSGGWVTLDYNAEGFYAQNPSLSVVGGTMTASLRAERMTCGQVMTRNAIDLSKYNTLVFTVTGSVDPMGENALCVFDDAGEKYVSFKAYTTPSIGKKTINVSGISGSYKIGMHLGVSSDSSAAQIVVSDIYLQ